MRHVFFVPILMALGGTPAAAATTATEPHVAVTLEAATTAVKRGEALAAGLRFVLEQGWHVYWQNPGDSGEPVKVAWTLPENSTAGGIEWPAPERLPVGPLMNYGYEGDVLLPVPVSVPAGIGGEFLLKADVRWLVCKEECIPGRAQLDLTLPVSDTLVASSAAGRFAAAKAAKPGALPAAWTTEVRWTDNTAELTVNGAGDAAAQAYFFPANPGILRHAAAQAARSEGGALRLTLARDQNLAVVPAVLSGVLKAGGKTYEVGAGAPSSTAPTPPDAPAAAGVTSEAPTTLLQALMLAFLGGLILNCMPCVFPVLSIKAVGLLKHKESRARSRQHGILYGIGVLTSFWLLAGLLLVLRAGGEQLGWGFQLQSPVTIFALALLLFLMGLNLAGVFEIRAGWVGIGHGLASRQEAIGDFFSGVLATLVATPCTAPFMGTALGFAAAQPAPIALSVFTALAVGLAAPYVLLAWFPYLGRWLPKPGRWMETLKQLMAFPLFATVIWLLWVLDLQAGPDAVALTLGALLLCAIAGWIYERWQLRAGVAAAFVTVAAAFALGLHVKQAPKPEGTAAAATSSGWETYSAARLDALRAEGKGVFLDFTAAWCVTCKVNEKVALGPETLADMRRRGVVPMQADWTNDDPEITAALRSFGRDGVPLYVLFGPTGEPKILPQILTGAIVTAALDELETSQKEKSR